MRDRKSDAHRTIASRKVGRKLPSNIVVDHLDEDKTNNVPGNLDPKPRGAHTAMHNHTRHISRLKASLRMPNERKKLY